MFPDGSLAGMLCKVKRDPASVPFESRILSAFIEALTTLDAAPRGVLPYMAYTGMCCWTGYGFWPLCPKQGM